MPQLAILTKQQRLFGPNFTRAASIDYGGQGIQMSFYVDGKMDVKRYFDEWMHKCVNPSKFTANYLKDYAHTVTVYQLNEKEERTYEIKLVESFPIASGPLSLDQGSNDTFHVFPVSLAYRYWETQDINNSVFPDSAAATTKQNTISFVPTRPGEGF